MGVWALHSRVCERTPGALQCAPRNCVSLVPATRPQPSNGCPQRALGGPRTGRRRGAMLYPLPHHLERCHGLFRNQKEDATNRPGSCSLPACGFCNPC